MQMKIELIVNRSTFAYLHLKVDQRIRVDQCLLSPSLKRMTPHKSVKLHYFYQNRFSKFWAIFAFQNGDIMMGFIENSEVTQKSECYAHLNAPFNVLKLRQAQKFVTLQIKIWVF